jgi:hypothetical protein
VKTKLKKQLKSLFGHQIAVVLPLLRGLVKFPISFPKAAIADAHRIYSNFKYKSQTILPEKLQAKIAELTPELERSDFDANNIRISFCGATRRKSNPNSKLSNFLQSIVDNCAELSQVEVLLAIDPDDDLDHFVMLKRKFEKDFRFVIFIAEKRLGYENLHLYDALLFPHLASNTRMICDYSDDCVITQEHFDQDLLSIDERYPDNIYFIHTRDTQRHHYLGDVSEHLQLLYWVMQAKEPASYFPIFSKKVLDIAYQHAKQHDKKNEWSPIANSWICDCYVDILANYVKRLGVDRIFAMDMIVMNKTILASYQYADPLTGMTPNNRAFIKMLNNQTLKYLEGLSEAIVKYANEQTVSIKTLVNEAI